MGTFDVRVRISSLDGSLQEETAMLVDTGATFSLLPASALRRLGVQEQLQVETQYDDAQSIGRRYRRQDEIGTPLCVTIDFETLDDRAVTIRDRDSMTQVRVGMGSWWVR